VGLDALRAAVALGYSTFSGRTRRGLLAGNAAA
jgi:hypothetical protein